MVYYLHGDHLGSTSLTTDQANAIVSQARYLPYGQERWTSGATPTDFTFTGQRSEAGFGLMDYNARYYSQVSGRFISPDSVVPGPENSQAWNRYAYTFNNPLKYTDPSGHCPWCVAIAVALLLTGCSTGSAPTPSTPVGPTPTAYTEKALLVFGGSYGGGSITEPGPSPEEQLPFFNEKATESVQYPGSKQQQANNVTGNYTNLQIVGYSAGADAALMYAHDYMKAGGTGITDIALLGPTMTGQMSDGRLENEWSNIMDGLLQKGVDIYLLDDDAEGDNARGYNPPENATGTFFYDERPEQKHVGGTNSSKEYADEVLDWFEQH